MLALRKAAAAPGVTLQDVAKPEQVAPGEVMVEVAAVGICGTDLHIDDWVETFHSMAAQLPVTLGHEFCGAVVGVGAGVAALKVGDRVVVQPAIGCGECAPCRAGVRHDCLNRNAIGMHRPGGFARYVCAPADYCMLMPMGMSNVHGALVEPLTTGAQAVGIGDVKPGDRVVVFGPGPIGQGAAIFAHRAGAKEVVVVGYNDAARFQTVHRLGFEKTVDLADGEAALKAAAAAGFDVAIDASGAASVINTALRVLRPYGVLVVAGMPETEANLDVMMLVRGRTQIRGCSRAPDWAWRQALDALSKNPEAFEPMVTHQLPLSEALEGFRLARARAASKVVLIP